MTRFNRIGLLALLAAAALGCSRSASHSDQSSKPKVALLLSTLQEERYQKDRSYFEDKARSLGLDPFTLAADNDNAKQLSAVEDALARGARVLVVQPTDSAAAAAYVAKAHERGAKIVAYDRGISGAPDFYVAHDSHEVGVIQAKEAIRSLGGKGNFVLLLGQSGNSVATEITRGYDDVLKPYVDSGAVKIVMEKNHDAWSPEQALKTVEDAIAKTGGDIQAILANNSGMARGAVQAVQAGGLGSKHVFIAGADADAANVNYVCEGKQSIEVLKDIRPIAEKAAEVASALARGEAVPDAGLAPGKVPTVAVPVLLVTPSNVKALIIDSAFHAPGEVLACAK
jgi:D-xylose transport system substrate-binding protein